MTTTTIQAAINLRNRQTCSLQMKSTATHCTNTVPAQSQLNNASQQKELLYTTMFKGKCKRLRNGSFLRHEMSNEMVT